MENFKNKTWLRTKYVDEKLSAPQICKMCKCSSTTILNWLRKFNIKIRSASDAYKCYHGTNGILQRKIELECSICDKKFITDRYYAREKQSQGKQLTCPYCSNSKAAKEKWKTKTEDEKKYIFKRLNEGREVFIQKLSPEERSARSAHAGSFNTSLSVQKQWESIYNTPGKLEQIKLQRGKTSKAVWDSLTPEQRNIRIQKSLTPANKQSKSCKSFLKTLHINGLILQSEYPISGFVVDGIHIESKTIIEFYGDFWHCNPKKYSDPQQFCSWLGHTVAQQHARDRKRLGVFYSLGYKVVIVWESNWRRNQNREIERIFNICNQ